jgi:RHS repeat-associated protein
VANVLTAQDYYPFGMIMPGRSYQGSGNYRYGFNGMEKDDEVKGSGNSYSTEFRKFDPRIGRWFSLDNYAHFYPSISPYSFSANSPLVFKDTDGNLLRDANGNIIVSKTGAAPKIQRMSNGLTITDTEVYIYGNDGTRHKAW